MHNSVFYGIGTSEHEETLPLAKAKGEQDSSDSHTHEHDDDMTSLVNITPPVLVGLASRMQGAHHSTLSHTLNNVFFYSDWAIAGKLRSTCPFGAYALIGSCQGWVFTFLDGDGKAFDFGIDISECAIQILYRAQNADEFTPYVCHLDHAVGKMLELGFNWQGTLINGAAVCDCRWKLGAETPSWPPIADTVLQNLYSKWEVSI